LVDWVLEHWTNGSLSKTVDTRLRGNYNTDEACLVLKLGLLCLHPFPSSRPSMRDVMQYLNGEIPLPELRPTPLSLGMQGLMQDNGFNTSVMSYPQLMSSFNAMSDLSGGRWYSYSISDCSHLACIHIWLACCSFTNVLACTHIRAWIFLPKKAKKPFLLFFFLLSKTWLYPLMQWRFYTCFDNFFNNQINSKLIQPPRLCYSFSLSKFNS
jgi:hypothetical protein